MQRDKKDLQGLHDPEGLPALSCLRAYCVVNWKSAVTVLLVDTDTVLDWLA